MANSPQDIDLTENDQNLTDIIFCPKISSPKAFGLWRGKDQNQIILFSSRARSPQPLRVGLWLARLDAQRQYDQIRLRLLGLAL